MRPLEITTSPTLAFSLLFWASSSPPSRSLPTPLQNFFTLTAADRGNKSPRDKWKSSAFPIGSTSQGVTPRLRPRTCLFLPNRRSLCLSLVPHLPIQHLSRSFIFNQLTLPISHTSPCSSWQWHPSIRIKHQFVFNEQVCRCAYDYGLWECEAVSYGSVGYCGVWC